MPNIASSIRQIRTDSQRTLRNKNIRTRVKTDIKKAEKMIDSGKLEDAEKAVLDAVSQLDKAAVKGVLHKNNTSRRKSRLVARLNRAKNKPASS